jgi:large subunit ribosomal protein L10
MAKEKKTKVINNLEDVFSRASIGILTDYRGITAPEMTNLRRKLRGVGIEYHVVKNTLARIAVKKAGMEQVASLFEGPVAVVVGYKDITEAAKTMSDYIQSTKSNMRVVGGFLPSKVLTAKEVATISTLPPRNVLLSSLLGEMQKPIAMLIHYLNAPVSGFVGVLQAIIQQLEVK